MGLIWILICICLVVGGWLIGKLLAMLIPYDDDNQNETKTKSDTFISHNTNYHTHNHLHISNEDLKDIIDKK